jgi:hypothetical protein
MANPLPEIPNFSAAGWTPGLQADWLHQRHMLSVSAPDTFGYRNAVRRMAEIEAQVSGEPTPPSEADPAARPDVPATRAMPLPANADLKDTGPIAGKKDFGKEGLPLSSWGSTMGGGNPNEMYRLYKEAEAAGYTPFAELWYRSPGEAIGNYNTWKQDQMRKGVAFQQVEGGPLFPSDPKKVKAFNESMKSIADPATPPAAGTTPPPAAGTTPPPDDDGEGTSDTAWDAAIKAMAERVAQLEDEARKTAGLLAEAKQAEISTGFAQTAAAQQLTALDVLSQPRASFFSQFARAPESKAEKPVFIQAGPELSAVMSGRTIPDYGTIGGPMETIENTPEAIRRAFEGAIEGLTTQSIQGMTPTALAQLGVLGQIGGYFPTEVFQAREKAIPREPKLFKSLQA